MLLRALQLNDVKSRQEFFTRMSGCRRRFGRKWAEKPVALALRDVASEFQLLQQRMQAEAVRLAVKDKKISLCGIKADQTTADFSYFGLKLPDAILLASDLSKADVSGSLTSLDLSFNDIGDEAEGVLREAVRGRDGLSLQM